MADMVMERLKYYKGLWLKIVLTTLAFSLIPLFVLGVTVYYQFSASHRAKIMESLRTLVENRRSSLDLFFDERLSQLITLANTQSLAQLKDEDYLQRVFDIMQARSKSFLDLGVIDDQGNHLAYVGPYYDILKGRNYREADWFSAVMSQGVYISDVFLGFRRVPHFIIAVTVREKKKTWILRATIDSDIIENIVREAFVGKKGDAFLINRANILQTSPRFSGRLLEKPTTPDFSTTMGTVIEQVSSGDTTYHYAATPIKNVKWVLVIKEDVNEQLTPLLRARFLTILILIGGALVIIIGAIFSTYPIIQELVEKDREKAASDEILMHSSKMAALGKMAAGIAHEINNPLAVIGEMAGWARDCLRQENVAASENLKEVEDSVKKIEYHVQRAKKITHRLLSFGRRMEPVSEMVDVNQVLAETLEFLENEARYRNIEIKTAYYPHLPRTTSDATQLQQVFLNIINNAIDAIGKDGEIVIRTQLMDKNREIVVEISDNGPGIPSEYLDKIFDPFFTTKEVGKGTGLGLSISYGIIEKLGGRMLVASQVGAGTTFTIYLPVK